MALEDLHLILSVANLHIGAMMMKYRLQVEILIWLLFSLVYSADFRIYVH